MMRRVINMIMCFVAAISFVAEAQDVKEFISFLDSVVVSPSVVIPYDSLPTFDSSEFDDVKIVRKDGVILEPVGNVRKVVARRGDMRYELVGDFITPDKSIIEYAPMIVVSNTLLQNEMVVRVDYNTWHGDVIVACINDFAVLDDKILLLGRAQDPRIGVSLVYDMSTQRLTVCGVTSDWISFSPDKQWVIKGDPSYPKFREPIEKHFGLVVDY